MRRFFALTLVLCLLLAGCGAGKEKPLADGSYAVALILKGGSGRATVQSPAELTVAGGEMTLRLVWSSSNYDYMIVDGEKYLPVTYEGGSTFEIPVKALADMTVIGDTVAMSTPHEVEYTIAFDGTPTKK